MATPVSSCGPRGVGGFTLVDVLVSLLFVALLAGTLQSFAVASMQAVQLRKVADDLDETARVAIEVMARDLRGTGYGLLGDADRGLRAAGPDRLALARDLDLDGSTTSPNEAIAYELRSESGQLRRRQGNASPQPMLEALEPDQTPFRYFDRDGIEISPGADLSAAQRSAVHAVRIELQLSAPHPVIRGARIFVDRAASVFLRNGPI